MPFLVHEIKSNIIWTDITIKFSRFDNLKYTLLDDLLKDGVTVNSILFSQKFERLLVF